MVATGGTGATSAVDPLDAIADLDLWLHVARRQIRDMPMTPGCLLGVPGGRVRAAALSS
ncbi:hypothetical protein [Amycolatopsis benzoatilytica]|uniref:hypothetical protein n=1 Tax=Amycolatopsis benzoatilytica TaxID=346045 RepID=UPI0003A91EF3|nr:hypothetical protein [Amycolatopsis benzoatilytica]